MSLNADSAAGRPAGRLERWGIVDAARVGTPDLDKLLVEAFPGLTTSPDAMAEMCRSPRTRARR
jgi:hypothetical protein